jgi:hypothetical protein
MKLSWVGIVVYRGRESGKQMGRRIAAGVILRVDPRKLTRKRSFADCLFLSAGVN